MLVSAMISDEEAAALTIREKPMEKPGPTGDALTLLNMMEDFCRQQGSIVSVILECQSYIDTPHEHFPSGCPAAAQRIEEVREVVEEGIRTLTSRLQYSESQKEQYSNLLRQLSDKSRSGMSRADVVAMVEGASDGNLEAVLSATIESHNQTLDTCRNGLEMSHKAKPQMTDLYNLAVETFREAAKIKLEKVEAARELLDGRVRKTIFRFISHSATVDIVLQSNAIHTCAYSLSPSYIEMLMSCVPDTKW